MSENIKYQDICSTCKSAQSCTFLKNSQKAVLNCEEFEFVTYPSVKTIRKDESPETTSVNAEDEDSGKFIGLCSNCDSRKTCVLPMPKGGIWHCEEYQ